MNEAPRLIAVPYYTFPNMQNASKWAQLSQMAPLHPELINFSIALPHLTPSFATLGERKFVFTREWENNSVALQTKTLDPIVCHVHFSHHMEIKKKIGSNEIPSRFIGSMKNIYISYGNENIKKNNYFYFTLPSGWESAQRQSRKFVDDYIYAGFRLAVPSLKK
jgi:hypothetical protein